MHVRSHRPLRQFNALKKEAKRVNNEHHHIGQAALPLTCLAQAKKYIASNR